MMRCVADAVRKWCFATVVQLPSHQPNGITQKGVDLGGLPAIKSTKCAGYGLPAATPAAPIAG